MLESTGKATDSIVPPVDVAINGAMAIQDKLRSQAVNHENFTPQQERALNEMISAEVAQFLAKSGISTQEALRVLHKLASHGVLLWEGATGQEIEGGATRNVEVQVGDSLVPPRHEDVPDLLQQFSEKLDRVMYQATPLQSEQVALWAYCVLMAIHPFPDVNGRTGRAMVDYVIQKIYADRGNDATTQYLQHDDEQLREAAYEGIARAQMELGLFPHGMSFSDSDQALPGGATSMDLYVAALTQGRADEYFQLAKLVIEQHMAAVTDVTVLIHLEPLRDFRRLLDVARNAPKYETRPLAVEAARAEYKLAPTQ